MRNLQPTRSRAMRAMTLIEVMLALAILVVLSVGVTAFFLQVSVRRDRLVEIAGRQRDAALLFGRLESAIMHAVTVGPDGSAGIKGSETSLAVVTRSVSPMLAGDAAVGDASVVTFEFDERSRSCTLGIEAVGAAGESERSVAEPVLGRVERVRLRYSDGRRWSGSFDSVSAGGLPVAVEVSIWFASAADDTEPSDPGEPPGEMTEQEREDFARFGSLDAPGFGPEQGLDDNVWIPREPDCLRVFGVPDAPEWKGRTS
ncbi:MAG: prepilin-type N-terminal cleavage/methylation domain-containing protein [Planctomycetota bacterium]|nr:prepilin-type N-terminal cleavage/methylation domain-containing protein [Planctomycetota bacterium]